MFETVVPKVTKKRKRFFIEMLPLSIAAHLAIAVSVFAANIWQINFPKESPKQFAMYSLTEAPPPPPPPPPPPRPAQVVPVKRVLMPDVAPNIIPDAIPEVNNEPPPPPPEPGGEEGGIEGGVVGGVVAAPPPPPPPPPPEPPKPEPARVEIPLDEPLPMQSLDQEYPAYPRVALMAGWEDSLVVKYLIGKDGNVKKVEVVKPPEHDDFIYVTLSTLKRWRFKPYIGRDGQPRELEHQLTVRFNIAKPSSH
jgi:protein TonB